MGKSPEKRGTARQRKEGMMGSVWGRAVDGLGKNEGLVCREKESGGITRLSTRILWIQWRGRRSSRSVRALLVVAQETVLQGLNVNL